LGKFLGTGLKIYQEGK